MENEAADRLWDKDVQEFIQTCKAKQLGDVSLGYIVMEKSNPDEVHVVAVQVVLKEDVGVEGPAHERVSLANRAKGFAVL